MKSLTSFYEVVSASFNPAHLGSKMVARAAIGIILVCSVPMRGFSQTASESTKDPAAESTTANPAASSESSSATSPATPTKPAAMSAAVAKKGAVIEGPQGQPESNVGAAIRFAVEKYTLPNGLTVLLHEDHSTPIISYQTWFRVGSKYEEPGFTGIAHLFEHMMFKGAKRYSGEQFDQMLQANGATNNAFTTHDYTGYYENLPSSKLELVIDIESDRMENLRITPENLKSEREVVKEERRFRVDNNPGGILRENIFATAFKVSPYRWPVIGYMTDIDNITLEKANEFYHTYYAPNNATVVVAGDFDSKDAKRLIEKYYGGLKSSNVPSREFPVEPAQTSPRSKFVSHEVASIQFALNYHTPKAGTDESYALDLLANIMGNGDSSRLHQRLVYKDQVATGAGAYNMTLQDAGIFQLFVTLKPGGDFSRAERALMGEVWRPRHILVTVAELQKAKNQVMKSYVDGLKTVYGKAESLAMNETVFHDYSQLFKDLDRYQAVTAEQVLNVAKKYLAPEQVSLVVLKPIKGAGKKTAQPAAHKAEAKEGAQ